jgi:hypothetical protein
VLNFDAVAFSGTRGAQRRYRSVRDTIIPTICLSINSKLEMPFLAYLSWFIMCAVAPISYAHLAAAQVGTFMKFEDMSDASSSQGGGHTSAGSVPVPELPRLHEKVKSTMFFC